MSKSGGGDRATGGNTDRMKPAPPVQVNPDRDKPKKPRKPAPGIPVPRQKA